MLRLRMRNSINTGTSTAPTYIEQTGAANPLNGISAGTFSAPDFVDLDSDGDLDVVVGNFAGNLSYYQNTGTSANPVYAQQTGAANPFNGIDVGSRANSAFVDVDFDGDLDAVVGGADGKLKYYKNTGSSLNPVYSQQTGVNNPFDNVLVAQGSAPMFVDGDGDSDLDLVIGDSTGTLSYYQNTAPVVDTLVSQTAGSVTITDFNGGDSDDNLTLTESAGTIIISDLIETFQVAGAATLVDSHTVSVVAASVTSPIVINLAGGVNTVIATTVTKDLMINGGSGYSTIKSGSGNDTINGGTGKSKIEGGAGADNLDGGSNDDDTVEYTSSAAGVTVDLSSSTASGGDAQGDVIVNFEHISGSAQGDVLTGDSNLNQIRGRAGNDTIVGGGGNDRLFGDEGNDTIRGEDGNDYMRGGAGADILDGGADIDTIYYIESLARVSVTLKDSGIAGVGSGGDAQGDTIFNVENVEGSDFSDNLTGNTGNNKLIGGLGDDAIFGKGGNDKIIGGQGADRLYGDAGNDILQGGDGSDYIRGGAGADILDGGADIDRIYYLESSAGVEVILGEAGQSGSGKGGDAQGDVIRNIENVVGSNLDDMLTGNGTNNLLDGSMGNDLLWGEDGNDKLIGGAGFDVLIGGMGADSLTGGQGIDTFVFFNLTDSLLSSRDRITDLEIGTDSIFSLNVVSTIDVDQLGTVANLGETAIRNLLTTTVFEADTAATFTLGSSTFLAINDSVAGFMASTDAVIDITGYSGSLDDLSIEASIAP
jgi:Ca2+-binding RTX toxin-like protein